MIHNSKTHSPLHLICLTFLFFCIPFFTSALTVSISQSGTAANSCSRTLIASVSGGSGSYTYTWSITTPGITFPGPNNLQSFSVALSETAEFLVTVTDNGNSEQASASTTVYRVLLGSFSVFIPNVITPNGDGVNDTWIIMDAPKVWGILNAYSYTLTVRNSGNTIVFSSSGTISSNQYGLVGGDITWNARVNGTGSIVPTGSYSYVLTLINCTQSTNYSGVLYVF